MTAREQLDHAEAAALAMIERGYVTKAAENFLREVKDHEDLALACVLLVEPYVRAIAVDGHLSIRSGNLGEVVRTAITTFAAKGRELLEAQR